MEIIASKRVFNSKSININTYACQFNNYTPEADEVSRELYDSIRGTVGVNKLPLTGRIYRALEGGSAIGKLGEAKKQSLWLVGIWHNVNPKPFEENVKKVKDFDVSVKTIGEMFNDARRKN